MDSTYFSSPEFQFWVQKLIDICVTERLACRPCSRLFSTLAYARLEMLDQDLKIKAACKEAGVKIVQSLAGKPMVSAEDYYRVFCCVEE